MSEFGIHTGQIASIWAPQEACVQMAVLLKSLCESIILGSRTTGTVIMILMGEIDAEECA